MTWHLHLVLIPVSARLDPILLRLGDLSRLFLDEAWSPVDANDDSCARQCLTSFKTDNSLNSYDLDVSSLLCHS